MPKLIHVTFRHGVRLDARKAHDLITLPCSQTETRTLFHQHDLAGTRFTIVTDDMKYDPARWGKRYAALKMYAYRPQFVPNQDHPFLLRVNRIRREGKVTRPITDDEGLDGLLTRLGDRAGIALLSYDVQFDQSANMRGDDETFGGIPSATIRGTLRVTDAALCTAAHLNGLGRAKRFGCGLLLTEASVPQN